MPDDRDAGPDRKTTLKRAFGYRDSLFAYAFAMLQDWALAEDVVQEAFVVAAEKWQQVEDEAALYPWLRGVVRNKARETIRARRREMIPEKAELVETIASLMEERLDEREADRVKDLRAALRQCMQGLGRTGLGLLEGFYFSNRTCEQLSEDYSRTPNAVRLALGRLRGKLRDCVSRRGGVLGATS